MRSAFVVVLSLFMVGSLPAEAKRLPGYPHRVDVDYNPSALVCPPRSRGTFGWASGAPDEAAGAVLWQEPRRAVMLHWEHPIWNATTQEYTVPLRALVTMGRAGSVLQIQATPPRPATRRSANRASGPAAQVGGTRLQSTAGMTFTTDSVFFRNDPVGYAVEVWATRAGSDGCSVRLATYTFHK